jgi:hypothetical protein
VPRLEQAKSRLEVEPGYGDEAIWGWLSGFWTIYFYGVRLLVHAQPPTWGTRVSLFLWLLPLDLSGMGDPTSSYATAGIALRVSGALEPHHHIKVETSLVEHICITYEKVLWW